jgi:hypothetical protein
MEGEKPPTPDRGDTRISRKTRFRPNDPPFARRQLNQRKPATILAHVRRTVTVLFHIKTRRKPSVTALMLYDHRKTATYWAR